MFLIIMSPLIFDFMSIKQERKLRHQSNQPT